MGRHRPNNQDDRHTVISSAASESDSDRFSRATHQTNLPHSTIAPSDHSERGYAESQHTDISSVPGTSRSSSHMSMASDVRPIVAKVRQDSYHRMQGHSNNLTN